MSYPYTQKENTVKGHVRMFKNSYRSALTESSIFKHRNWDLLYPLVLIRLNTMITKYGMSREIMQFGDVTEHNLPIVTDSVLYEPLEEDLDEISKLFKARVGRFINKKKANKKYYKIRKDIKFNNHELVMYQVYNPSNLLADTFAGPAQIIEIQPKGATLRDLKTGDKFSVSFNNLRKVNFKELLVMLLKNFDKDLD